jgi:protein phosphatase
MNYNVGSHTHPGKRRRKNEDAVLVLARDAFLLLAVADGVGGERGGEVASQEAARAIEARFAPQSHLPDPALALANSIVAANDAVYSRASGDRRLRGMATTIVAAIIRDGAAWMANVGDSRAYLVDATSIQQITNDHSLVAESVEAGHISADDARTSGARHVITRSVGGAPTVEVDLFGPLTLGPDQVLLLCSDGLTDVVDDAAIRDIVASLDDLGEAARALVAEANGHGGPDNISVVLHRPSTPANDHPEP